MLASLNLLTTLALVGVLFIMVNYIASRRYGRWDLTRQKITALSPRTLQTLQALQEPVAVTVFYRPTHRLYDLVRDLLKEYERAGEKIRVEFVDPEQDVARAKQLANAFDIKDPNVVIFQAGTRHKHVSDVDLAEYDYTTLTFQAEPRVKAFSGEEAFTSAIVSVTQGIPPLVWMIAGHGEKSADSIEADGLAELKKALEQQDMSVQAVNLLERRGIPPEVKLVIIAGPARRWIEPEVAWLQAYLEGGGRALALMDPLDDSGLDGLLSRWGIELGLDIVVDPERQLPFVSAANLFVTTYTEHPIVGKMKTLMTLYPLARSVRPATPSPEGIAAAPLALTSEAGWGETQTAATPFAFNAGEDLPGPVSIAVAAERAAPLRTRLVVVGDSDFVANDQLGNIGNRDFLYGALYWLLGEEQRIGIGPKAIESLKLSLTGGQLAGLCGFSILALPIGLGLLGAIMWFVRRR